MLSHRVLRLLVDGLSSAAQEPTVTTVVSLVGGEDTFLVDYTPGFISVRVNGVSTENFVATDGTSVVLNTPLTYSDTVEFTAVKGARAQLLQFIGTVANHTFTGRDVAVPAHRHRNPNGSLGGWVAETAYVENTVSVSPDSEVFDAAVVTGASEIVNSYISGQAIVRSTIVTASDISEDTIVSHSTVYDSLVAGGSNIHGAVLNDADLDGYPVVLGGEVLLQHAMVRNTPFFSGSAVVNGDSPSVKATVSGYVRIGESGAVNGDTTITDNSMVRQGASIEESSISNFVVLTGEAVVTDCDLTDHTQFHQNTEANSVVLPSFTSTPLLTADPNSPFNRIYGHTIVPGDPDEEGNAFGSIDGDPNPLDD